MICFVSVSTFRKRIVELLKVKRGVYGGVTNEICQAFKDATIEQIRQNRDMILLNNDAAVIKLRMPDKKQHLSKADGYRLIYMVMKQSPLVALLDVYPKRGPSQQLDIEDNETARLVMEFVTELQANLLVMHDINDNLKSIAQE
jgi:mRNA-degrading endonuclease RelE of RelBE toxin-antitoxin system